MNKCSAIFKYESNRQFLTDCLQDKGICPINHFSAELNALRAGLGDMVFLKSTNPPYSLYIVLEYPNDRIIRSNSCLSLLITSLQEDDIGSKYQVFYGDTTLDRLSWKEGVEVLKEKYPVNSKIPELVTDIFTINHHMEENMDREFSRQLVGPNSGLRYEFML